MTSIVARHGDRRSEDELRVAIVATAVVIVVVGWIKEEKKSER